MLPPGDNVPTRVRSSAPKLRVALIALAVALFGCTDQGPTEPLTGEPPVLFGAFPGTNGLIAFASNRSPVGGILTMDLGGFNVQSVRATGSGPAWSPNGTRIAFVDHDGNDNEIFVMNADGTGATPLTNNTAHDEGPSWSADGTKIVYHSNASGANQIFTIANTGGAATQLTTSGSNFAPSWSPDGTKIAFTSTRDGNFEIYVMAANGSAQTRLTTDVAERDFDPTWSPDGSQIAFTHGGEVGSDIYVMNANGTNPLNFTQSPTYADVSAAWSPDGSRILFVSDRDGNSEIYAMWASDGSGEQNQTVNSAGDTQPDWQPVPTGPPDVTEDVEALIAAVAQLNVHKSVKNSLTASLNNVLAALDAGDTAGACSALGDFVRKTQAQSGKKIPAADASALIAQAAAISDDLNCG